VFLHIRVLSSCILSYSFGVLNVFLPRTLSVSYKQNIDSYSITCQNSV